MIQCFNHLAKMQRRKNISSLEAMACGVAFVATDAGADREVLEGGSGVILRTQGVTTQLKTLLYWYLFFGAAKGLVRAKLTIEIGLQIQKPMLDFMTKLSKSA